LVRSSDTITPIDVVSDQLGIQVGAYRIRSASVCRSPTARPSWYDAAVLEHRLAKAAAVATFCLLVIGGMVNATGSSLACAEPTLMCNGQLLPPMTGGVLYEHGHRLFAMSVGLLQIALTVTLAMRRPRLRGLGFVLLGMVIAQGTFGAITVAFKLPWFVSTSHLLLGMSYFAMLIYTAFRTRPEPSVIELDRHARLRGELGERGRRWIAVACIAVMAQVLLGALVRHLGAALVCLGMPACTADGAGWPDAAIQDLHMLHRGVGCAVAVVTTVAAVQVGVRARSWPALRAIAVAAPVVVAAQLALGVATVLTLRAVPLAVAHFAGAMTLWALWMSAWLTTRERTVAAAVAPKQDAFERARSAGVVAA
jgi:cytochrome c oxidase assembly protein subunit 15